MPTRNAPPTAASLHLIRISLALGVMLFACVIWFQHRQPGWSSHGFSLPALQWAQLAASFVAVAFTIFMRERLSNQHDIVRRAAILMPGWMLGEAAALLGAVIYYLTDDARFLGVGLAVLFATFLLLPVQRNA
ncbi:MAG: hypothetical protein ABJD07_11810 [Gemmatimonadaceae bacterium]